MILWIVLAPCGTALLNVAFHLARSVQAIARGSMDGDVLLYLLMGRGMLNGLQLYVDLYESKPPGMFALSALSLITTGDAGLLTALQICGLVLVPMLLGWYGWRCCRGKNWMEQLLLVLTQLGIGILLMLYLEERASGMETESFGSFFGILFALCLAMGSGGRSRVWDVLAGLALLATVMMKEPFLLTMLAVAMLLCRSRADVLRYAVIFALAGLAGALLLWLAGYLEPYVSVHLKNMLFERTHFASPLPLWLRALHVRPVFVNLTELFPASPLLGYLLAALWSMVPVFRTGRGEWRDVLLSVATSVTLYFLCIRASIVLSAWDLAAKGYSLDDASMLPAAQTWLVILVPLAAGLLWMEWKRGLLWETLLALGVLLLVSLTVVASGYSGNHFAAAVPVYATLALLCSRYVGERNLSVPVIGIAILATVVMGMHRITPEHERYWAESQKNLVVTEQGRLAIQRFDAMMDACGIERYMGSMEASILGRHTVWGPLPIPGNFANLPDTHPLQTRTRENRERNGVYLLGVGADSAEYPEYGSAAPDCAKPFLPIPGYTVLFR